MASIRKRIAPGCVTWSYQVQIRRKGIPSYTITFATYDAAKNWVEENEEDYIKNPHMYPEAFSEERLAHLRDTEFSKNINKKE